MDLYFTSGLIILFPFFTTISQNSFNRDNTTYFFSIRSSRSLSIWLSCPIYQEAPFQSLFRAPFLALLKAQDILEQPSPINKYFILLKLKSFFSELIRYLFLVRRPVYRRLSAPAGLQPRLPGGGPGVAPAVW